MKPTKHAQTGPRMVVLHKINVSTYEFIKFTLIEGLEKETTVVAEYLRLDDDNFRDFRRSELHQKTLS
jgi:hypothetical protein